MKVEELQELLSKEDPDKIVIIDLPDGTWTYAVLENTVKALANDKEDGGISFVTISTKQD